MAILQMNGTDIKIEVRDEDASSYQGIGWSQVEDMKDEVETKDEVKVADEPEKVVDPAKPVVAKRTTKTAE